MQKCDQIRNNRYQGDAVWNSPLFHANAAVLLMTTACMAAAVISPKPWAPLIPLWVVFIPWFYLPAQLERAVRLGCRPRHCRFDGRAVRHSHYYLSLRD